MFTAPFVHSQKRPREEEDHDSNIDLFDIETRHESKKLRALPFRTSPTLKHSSFFSDTHAFTPRPQTLTPVDSSEDGSDDDELPDSQSRHGDLSAVLSNHDDDMEMADSDAPVSSPLPWQEQQSSCPSIMPPPMIRSKRTRSPPRPTISTQRSNFLSAPTSVNETGRLPTPIYGHFSQATSGPSMPGIPNAAALRMSAPISPIPASPMSPSDATAETAWWRRRRLPSPAEDHEDGDDNDVPMSPLGVIDTMLPRLNVSPPSRTHGLADAMVIESHQPETLASERRPPSPFGRARSNATSTGTATNGPSSSSRLSMGYRADCEKCLKRVPGHYTHILRN